MKNIIFHRDFLAFILLLVICKTAIDLKNPTINTEISPAASSNQIASNHVELPQEPTIALHEPAAVEKKLEPFMAQEIENNIIKQIECAQLQIRKTIDIAPSTSLEAAQLYSLLQKLSTLHTQYTTSLPQEANPDPLKIAAMNLEENDIKKDLLETIQKFASILHTLAKNTHEPAGSAEKELEINHHLLNKLIRA